MAVDLTTIATGVSILAGLATIGLFGYARRIIKWVESHHRILHGEPDVEEWNGIVPQVLEHDEKIAELENELSPREHRTDGALPTPPPELYDPPPPPRLPDEVCKDLLRRGYAKLSNMLKRE